MQNKIVIFVVSGILLISVLGCSFLKKASEVVDKAAQPKIVTSTDNKVQLTVPQSWTDSKILNDDATLQVMQPLRELYTIIIPDDKKDFDKSADLDFVANTIRENYEQAMSDTDFTKPVSIKVNGFDSKQFQGGATVDKIKAKFIFTIIETPDFYYQIMSWTLDSKFTENEKDLREVINSFKLANDNNTPPPPKAK